MVAAEAIACGGTFYFECGCDGMVGQVVLSHTTPFFKLPASLPVILIDDSRQTRSQRRYENARQAAFSQHTFLHSARLLSASIGPNRSQTAPEPTFVKWG